MVLFECNFARFCFIVIMFLSLDWWISWYISPVLLLRIAVFIDLVTHLASTTDITSIDTKLTNFIRQHTQTNESILSPLPNEKSDILDSFLEKYDNETNTHKRPPKEITSAKASEKKPRPIVEPATEIRTDEVNSDTNYFENEDNIKTIIDIIRLSEHNNKKLFVRDGITATGLLILFCFLDITFQ